MSTRVGLFEKLTGSTNRFLKNRFSFSNQFVYFGGYQNRTHLYINTAHYSQYHTVQYRTSSSSSISLFKIFLLVHHPSTTTELDFYRTRPPASSSLTPIHLISLLITSLQLSFDLPLPLFPSKYITFTTFIASVSSLLLKICPSYLNLFPLISSPVEVTLVLSLIYLFIFVYLSIHSVHPSQHSLLGTLILYSVFLSTARLSDPYIIAGLNIVL